MKANGVKTQLSIPLVMTGAEIMTGDLFVPLIMRKAT